MIEVTRLNGLYYFLNPDQILAIEPTPDTVITLLNGDKVVVKESVDMIRERFVAYKQQIHAMAAPPDAIMLASTQA